jgi:hypothetical protein
MLFLATSQAQNAALQGMPRRRCAEPLIGTSLLEREPQILEKVVPEATELL